MLNKAAYNNEGLPSGKQNRSPDGRRYSRDNKWETSTHWPKGLLRYVPSGMFFARLRVRPRPPVRISLQTQDYTVACEMLRAKLAELKLIQDRN